MTTRRDKYSAELGRRSFLGLTGVSAAAFLVGTGALPTAEATGKGRIPGDPFGLGVASGDPRPDGFVAWTRLAPEPLAEDGHGGMPLRQAPVGYEVSEDEAFRTVVHRGNAIATPELGHSIHAEITGLQPGRTYFYRFRTGNEISPVGRTRTAPAPGSSPDALRFTLASCQAWYHGFFTAYQHMANEELDAVFFLGDYIYEYGITKDNLWRNVPLLPAAHTVETETLSQYRLRYSLFKSDPDLQAIHSVAPWILTPDDHEVKNNYAGSNSASTIPPEDFLRRRAVAYRAYYENLPFHSSSLPQGPNMSLYRRFDFGDLAQFNVLDTRQFRRVGPDGIDGDRWHPDRTMLGAEQESWLLDNLSRSKAKWNFMSQQVVMAQIDRTPGEGESFSLEQWDGFPASRDRLISSLVANNVSNPVVLTGDIHRHVAADLTTDFNDPNAPVIGSELVTTSIGSNGDGAPTDSLENIWMSNPHVKLYNAQRGYVSCTLTPDELRADYKVVPYIQQPGAPLQHLTSFSIQDGRPGLRQITAEAQS